MIISTALLNSLPYPLTPEQIEVIATQRGLDLSATFTRDVSRSPEYQLSQADAIRLMITAPNVSEGGVSISFSDRKFMMSLANAIYSKYGEPLIKEDNPTVEFMKDW